MRDAPLASEMLQALLIAALALAGLADRWQGAWVVRDADYPGSVEAWDVQDHHVVVYDARRGETKHETFEVVAPCRLQRTLALPDGTSRVTFDAFVLAADGLHVGLGPESAGGVLLRGSVTACVGNDVYDMRAGEHVCSRLGPGAEPPPVAARAECDIVPTGVGSAFVIRQLGGGDSVQLPIYGDVLMSPALAAHRAERQPSFAAAVLRADAIR